MPVTSLRPELTCALQPHSQSKPVLSPTAACTMGDSGLCLASQGRPRSLASLGHPQPRWGGSLLSPCTWLILGDLKVTSIHSYSDHRGYRDEPEGYELSVSLLSRIPSPNLAYAGIRLLGPRQVTGRMVYSVKKRWGRKGRRLGRKQGWGERGGGPTWQGSCGFPATLRATAGQGACLTFREHTLTSSRTAEFKASVA